MTQPRLSGIFSLLLFLTVTQIWAQDSVKVLSLEQAVSTAIENNARLRIAATDEEIAMARYRQSDAVYLPQLSVSYSALTTNNPLNSFGFKLQQQAIRQADFNPDLLNNPSNTGDFMTRIDLQQPLINPEQWYMRKGAQKQVEMMRLQTRRGKEIVQFETEKAYLQLQLVYESVRVVEEALQTAREVYRFTKDRYDQGLMQKADLLNVQVQVVTMEANLATAKNNIRNASDYLGFLMGSEPGIQYQTAYVSSVNQPETSLSVPLERTDFLAMKKAIEASSLMISSSKKSYLPKLNAFGTYQLNDRSMFGFGSNAYFAGVQLSWDIFKGFRTKNMIATQLAEKSKLEQQLSEQVAQSQLELQKAIRDVSDHEYRIRQQEAAVEQAAEAVRILRDRYGQGLANTTDLLLAQTQLSQQKLQLVQAQYKLQVTRAQIKLLTTTSN
ncbi:TolC family protein [Flavihumibacter fluminis]|jgi:outer membrane protein TolC|uniref:TolC family protein n=1 Tax=Flavihumibacter fluminis TaxID=2909236 RepID=UPI001F2642A7|nr:TolC family protein [Flavihumibacter fluminis]